MLYVVTSDIHLGHRKTPTIHICNSFRKCILSEKNKSVEVIFISGDFFDRLLDLNSKEILLIIDLFTDILNYCFANNIALRVLEGTSSHDNMQSQLLVKLNDIRKNKCDLRYFKVLDIEYIERLQKYVLYIPDEWTNSHEELESQIIQKLYDNNIQAVDIAILHGQFKYQFAGRPYTGFYFKEEYFLKIVKGFIHIGHYHIYSKLDRIIANGSLERIKHDEESPKGYVVVKDNNYEFVENPYAYTYKTISITNKTTIESLDRQIFKLPKESYVRLKMRKEHQFNAIFQELKLRYLDYFVKKHISSDDSEDKSVAYILTDTEIEMNDKFVLEGNLYGVLLENIFKKHTIDGEEHKKLLNYISIFQEKELDNEPTTDE